MGAQGGTDLCFYSPQHQLTVRSHGYVHLLYTACLIISQLSLLLIAPTHGWMARLSRLRWLVK